MYKQAKLNNASVFVEYEYEPPRKGYGTCPDEDARVYISNVFYKDEVYLMNVYNLLSDEQLEYLAKQIIKEEANERTN